MHRRLVKECANSFRALLAALPSACFSIQNFFWSSVRFFGESCSTSMPSAIVGLHSIASCSWRSAARLASSAVMLDFSSAKSRSFCFSDSYLLRVSTTRFCHVLFPSLNLGTFCRKLFERSLLRHGLYAFFNAHGCTHRCTFVLRKCRQKLFQGTTDSIVILSKTCRSRSNTGFPAVTCPAATAPCALWCVAPCNVTHSSPRIAAISTPQDLPLPFPTVAIRPW